jgi:hypothetical protein
MKEREKINNPNVEYDAPSSNEEYYYSMEPMEQSGRFKARFDAIWGQVSLQDKKHIIVIILAAMLVMLFLNILNVMKILKQ